MDRSTLLGVFGAVGVLMITTWLSLSPFGRSYPTIPNALLLDFIVTAPAIYGLAVWFGSAPAKGLKWVLIAGVILAYFILPESAGFGLQSYLPALLPIIELILFATIFVLVWRALSAASAATDAYPVVQTRVQNLLGTNLFSKLLGSEIAMLTYVLRPGPIAQASGPSSFSAHRTSGFRAILGALVAVTCLELIVVHVVVHLFSPIAAWILSGLSALSLLTLVGHIRALNRRVHTISETGHITLRNGLFGTLHTQQSNIQSAEVIQGYGLTDTARFAILGEMEPANILIKFHAPVRYHISHGITREVTSLLFHTDHPVAFTEKLLGDQ